MFQYLNLVTSSLRELLAYYGTFTSTPYDGNERVLKFKGLMVVIEPILHTSKNSSFQRFL